MCKERQNVALNNQSLILTFWRSTDAYNDKKFENSKQLRLISSNILMQFFRLLQQTLSLWDQSFKAFLAWVAYSYLDASQFVVSKSSIIEFERNKAKKKWTRMHVAKTLEQRSAIGWMMIASQPKKKWTCHPLPVWVHRRWKINVPVNYQLIPAAC